MITGGFFFFFFKCTHIFSAWTGFVTLPTVGLLQATQWKTQLYIELVLSHNVFLNK